MRGLAIPILLATATAAAGCGSNSTNPASTRPAAGSTTRAPSAEIVIAKKTTTPIGIKGQIVKMEGDIATVTGRETNAVGKAAGPTVTRTVKLFSSEGVRVGDQVYFTQTENGGFEDDKAADARNNAPKVLAESSTCAEWKQVSMAERNAFIEQFATAHGLSPTEGGPIAIMIGGRCSLHPTSTIGPLAAEGLPKN